MRRCASRWTSPTAVLGHFRHEIGHYYQDLLAPEGSSARDRCRALFGDDRADYQQAMKRHYAHGPRPDWHERFVSAYATMHPWEDWAETLPTTCIRDALQTAKAYGISIADPTAALGELVAPWQELSIALNAMNRSVGRLDLCPFVLTAPVVEKLVLIDDLVRTATSADA